MLQEVSTVAHTYWTQFLYLLPRLVAGTIVLALVWLASERLRLYLSGKLSAHSADPLLANFLTQVGRWLLVLAGLLLALQIVGFSGVVGSVLGGLGLSAFLVGFAFKDIAENFLAGVILAFNRPFHIHDNIQIKDIQGRVLELNLRTTRIKTTDGKDIYVPNSLVLKEPVTNFTRDGHLRQDFAISLDYHSDTNAALALMLTQLEQEPEVLHEDAYQSFAVVEDLADSKVNVRVYFWVSSRLARRQVLELRSRLITRIKAGLLAAKDMAMPSGVTEVHLVPDQPTLHVQVEEEVAEQG